MSEQTVDAISQGEVSPDAITRIAFGFMASNILLEGKRSKSKGYNNESL